MELLERDVPLGELGGALQDAIAGNGRIVLISGEAGIGKTSLVEKFTAEQKDLVRVLWGVCDAMFTPRPLGPLYDIAAQAPGNLSHLLNSDANRAAIFSAVLGAVQEQPTVAVFEDVHWADETTLDLLRFFGRRIARTAALLVLTYREDELNLQHPLRTLLGDLVTSATTRRISLQPLTETAVRTLIGARNLDAAALHRQTGGSPFFVTEVLASAGDLLPSTIRDAVLARVARLSLSAQAVLQAAAIIGNRIEPWLLAAVTSAEAPAADECLTSGMLQAQGEMLVFRHELSRQAVLDAIPLYQRIVLHRLVFEALRASPTGHNDLARLAHHAGAARDRKAILEFAPAAARQASVGGAHRGAAALYALALRYADELPLAERALLLETHARESLFLEEVSTAIESRRQAIKLWRQSGERLKEGENLAYLAIALNGVEKWAKAEQTGQAAIQLLETLPPGRELAVAYRTQALFHLSNRDCAKALALAEKAASLAERVGDALVLAMAYDTLGSAWMYLDYERGSEILQRCLEIATEARLDARIATVYANLGSISCELYHLKQAEQYLAQGLTFTADRDLDMFRLYLLAWHGLTLLYLGRWREAEEAAAEVLRWTRISAQSRVPALVVLGRLQSRQGADAPHTFLDKALEITAHSGHFQHLAPVRSAQAEAAWLANDGKRTLEEAQALYDLAISKQHREPLPMCGKGLCATLSCSGGAVSTRCSGVPLHPDLQRISAGCRKYKAKLRTRKMMRQKVTLVLVMGLLLLSSLFVIRVVYATGSTVFQSLAAGPVAYQVKDIVTVAENNDSNPNDFIEMGGIYYFVASTDKAGQELWRTDGTVAGTYMVKDIHPGPLGAQLYYLTVMNGILYFSADNGNLNHELWRSDGTTAGTYMVKDINPGAGGGGPQRFIVVDGTLFFIANDGTYGLELWKSDGTEAGTVIVKDIYPGPLHGLPGGLYDFDGTLFFSAKDGVNGTELWKSDGTQAGTVMVADIYPGPSSSSPSYLEQAGGDLFFRASDGISGLELWKSDGTITGTLLVSDIYSGSLASNPSDLTNLGGTLLFTADDGVHGEELWKSDGTELGTVLVSDIYSGTNDSNISYLLDVFGSQAIFAADDGVHGRELWKSDGTPGNTIMIKDINPGDKDSFPGSFVAHAGLIYFYAYDDVFGDELWRSDGTEMGTVMVSDINPGAEGSGGFLIAATNSGLLFGADDGVLGDELWYSDGTDSGTNLLKELNPPNWSAEIEEMVNVNNTLFFVTDDGIHGQELWKSDGTQEGTLLVKDIYTGTGSSRPEQLVGAGGMLYFIATNDVYGDELWRSDGTEVGTYVVKDIDPGPSGSNVDLLTNANGTLFFEAYLPGAGRELWKSDGTQAGTTMVKDIYPGGSSSNLLSLTNVNGTLFFHADDGVDGSELWKSDGTITGTVQVKDIRPGSFGSSPHTLTVVDGLLFFLANDGATGYEPWRSDGTPAGTELIVDTYPGTYSYAESLAAVGSILYFSADDGVSGQELWRSDGTPGGTGMVLDIVPGAGDSQPENLTDVNGSLYFAATDTTGGRELWRSNGTAGGTLRVADLYPGINGANPEWLTSVGNLLFFAASDGQNGVEVWIHNSNKGNILQLKDIAPGGLSSAPKMFTQVGPRVFFTANDNLNGSNRELWAFSLATDPAIAQTAAPKLVTPGDAFTVTLTYNNHGLSPATGTVITAVLPAELTNVTINSTPPITGTGVSPAYVWEIGTLTRNDSGVITITGAIDLALTYEGMVTSTATITTSAKEVNFTDNTALDVFEINLPPTVDAGPDQTITAGVTFSLTASFTDPGVDDTHTAVVDWADGTLEAGMVDQVVGTVSGSHVYSTTGQYSVTVTVTDDDGGEHSDALTVTVTAASADGYEVFLPLVTRGN
jgi:ELWxxDGT repeat protein